MAKDDFEEFELEEEPKEEKPKDEFEADFVEEAPPEETPAEEVASEEPLIEEEGVEEAPTGEEAASGESAPEEQVPQEPAEFESEGLLEDINFPVIVSLGRTVKSVKEILKFREGQIIELHKVPTEPVEVLANGTPIARGKLVEVDGKLGVKITQLLK